jgi:spermidine synthase
LSAHLISQHPNPKNILIIGEAISGLAQQLLKYDLNKIISVEIDENLVNTISTYLPESDKTVLADDRFEMQIKDGKKWIKSRVNKQSPEDLFDIIFLNLSEPSTLFLNRYYTVEFYNDLSRILKRDGVLGLRVTSSENYAQGFVSDYTTSLYNTLKRTFTHIVIAPGEKNLFFASRGKKAISDSPETLASRYEKTGASPRNLGLIFKSIYPKEKTEFIKKFLESNKNNILNTDEKPILMFYYNKILGWINNKNTERFYSLFEKQTFINMVMFILGLFALRLIFMLLKPIFYKQGNKKGEPVIHFNIIICIFTGGLFGLSLELFILYSFQNIYGYIYQIIGFVISLFMAGLPVGALFSTRIIRSPRTTRTRQLLYLLSFQVFIIIILIGFPYLIKLFSSLYTVSNILFFILTIVIGIIVGAIFPLALSLHFTLKGNIGKTAGIIDAADHLGAAFGAFFSGAILLPILGVTKSCLLLGVLAIFTTLLLAFDWIRTRQIPRSDF